VKNTRIIERHQDETKAAIRTVGSKPFLVTYHEDKAVKAHGLKGKMLIE